MSDDTFHVTHWAGLDLARPQVMGILNVTPDSSATADASPR